MYPICSCCGKTGIQLPKPNLSRSMISDGRIIKKPLEKSICFSCGAIFHTFPPSLEEVHEIYSDTYSLTKASISTQLQRASRFVECLLRYYNVPPARILEVGCGSGATLHLLSMHWKSSKFVGIDPTLDESLDSLPQNRNITLYKKSLATANFAPSKKFDLIFSINTIEHLYDLQASFFIWKQLLSLEGKIFIICPSSEPNLEVLFYDHLYSLTQNTIKFFAKKNSLFLRSHESNIDGSSCFQLFVLERKSKALSKHPDCYKNDDLRYFNSQYVGLRVEYLNKWSSLDSILMSRIGLHSEVVIFGAGEMSALLRTYLPDTWSKCKFLVVDNPSDAWDFEKPVLSYDNFRSLPASVESFKVIASTSPKTQNIVKSRLEKDGFSVVVFDDIISK